MSFALSRLTKEDYDFNSDNTLSGGAGQQASDFTASYTYDLVGNRVSKTVDQNNDGRIDQGVPIDRHEPNPTGVEKWICGAMQ